MKENVKTFQTIANELVDMYERKNHCYGNSFSRTYQELGLISAITRISDKFNRLSNLATKSDIYDLGESIEDTLRDMACYAIMTIMELNTPKTINEQTKTCLVDITMDEGWVCIEDFAHAFTRGKWYPKTANNVIKGDDGVDYVATPDIIKKFIQTPIK